MSAGRAAGLAIAGLLAAGCAGLEPLPAPPPTPAERAARAIEEGSFLLSTGEHDLAFRTFIRAARHPESRAEGLTGAGLALEAQGLLGAARAYFERARDAAPGSELAHNNLGVVLYKLGDYEGARIAFRTAFAISSGTNRIAAHNLRAVEAEIDARRTEERMHVNARIERLGTSEYRLIPATPDTAAPAAPIE